MLEVGSCRYAHQMTVLAKNVMDSVISASAFCTFCFIESPGLVKDSLGRVSCHLTLSHSAFCATAVTICSGAMAERTHMIAYLLFAVFMASVIYPQIVVA